MRRALLVFAMMVGCSESTPDLADASTDAAPAADASQSVDAGEVDGGVDELFGITQLQSGSPGRFDDELSVLDAVIGDAEYVGLG